MSKSVKQTAQINANNDDDYYEDEFETYEDEWSQADDKQTTAQPKASVPTQQQTTTSAPLPAKPAKGISSSTLISNFNNTPMIPSSSSQTMSSSPSQQQLFDSRRIFQADDKKPPPSNATTKSYSNTSSLFAKIADPRMARMQRILKSNVLDLKITKSTLLNIPPTSEYELHLQTLRSANASIRQIGVPNDLEYRDADIMTEEITQRHQEVQVCYGDDTQFFALIKMLENKKAKQQLKKKAITKDNKSDPYEEKVDGIQISSTSSSTYSYHDGNDSSADIGGAGRLSQFLRYSSSIIERLLSEKMEATKQLTNKRNGGQKGGKLLFESQPWIALGNNLKEGSNELIRNRMISSCTLSQLQPNMLITVHPYPTQGSSANDDLRPFKGFYVIWDIANNPGAPEYILEASSQVTCAAFSSSHWYYIVGGSDDGCLHLYDLREGLQNHTDKDSIDLNILRGIRKPSYSTHMISQFDLSILRRDQTSSNTTNIHKGNRTAAASTTSVEEDIDEAFHTARIQQIENVSYVSNESGSLGSSSNSLTQFVSLDETGTLIFWVVQDASILSSNKQNYDANIDLRLSPCSTVSLRPTRRLSVYQQPRPLEMPSSSSLRYASDTKISLLSMQELLACNAPTIGKLRKLARVGEPSAPALFERANRQIDISAVAQSKNDNSSAVNNTSLEFASPITCIAIRGNKNKFILTGREDGSLDLFLDEARFPLLSWSLNFDSNNNKKSVSKRRILQVAWLGFSPSSFMVVDSQGILHLFDLTMDISTPFCTEALSNKSSPTMVLITKQRLPSDDSYIIAVNHNSQANSSVVNVRSIHSSQFSTQSTNKYIEKEEKELLDRLRHAILPTLEITKVDFKR